MGKQLDAHKKQKLRQIILKSILIGFVVKYNPHGEVSVGVMLSWDKKKGVTNVYIISQKLQEIQVMIWQ